MDDIFRFDGQDYYAGREAGWHNKGTIMDNAATFADWARNAGFEHTIIESPIWYEWNGREMKASDRKGLIHSGTGNMLNCVSNRYKVVQPMEILEFFRESVRDHGWALETAGTLARGAKYWTLARVGDNFRIAGDEHAPYLLLATSCDGSLATSATFTTVRVVCQNTLSAAIGSCEGMVKTRHSKVFDPDSVKRNLGILHDGQDSTFQAFAEKMNRLANTPISEDQAIQFFAEITDTKTVSTESAPVTVDPDQFDDGEEFGKLVAESLTRELRQAPIRSLSFEGGARKAESLLESYRTAPGARPGTAYGLLQAVTHHVDHVSGRSEDTRLASAMFGAGAALKDKAVKLLAA